MPGKSSETAEHALTGGARVPIITADQCDVFKQRVTYEGFIKDILRQNCTKCHAPRLVNPVLGKGYAVEPVLPYFTDWADVNKNKTLIVDLTKADIMPPGGSELPLPDDVQVYLNAWADEDFPRGSALPKVELRDIVKSAGFSGSIFTITYNAADANGEWEPEHPSGTCEVKSFIDTDTCIALFYTTSASGYNPYQWCTEQTMINQCLPLGYNRTYRWSVADVPPPPAPYRIVVCAHDGDNVYCDGDTPEGAAAVDITQNINPGAFLP